MTGPHTGDTDGRNAILGARYRLIRPIGSGGMAVVWEARDEVLNRTVAIKVLAGRHLGDPQSRDLIRQEAQAAAALSHPNIAHVHDYGETATKQGIFPYVVMELVRGDTLQTRAAQASVPPRFAMRVCAEVAAALAAAHAEGIVHRDVKPANVMLAPTGAKVVDFGIAAAVAPGRPDDDDFEVLGTPAYLAPERLISDVVEPASDVYALAILLYQLLAGCLPWTSETTTQMLSDHIYVDPEPLRPTPGVPAHVVDLCNRCLTKDPTLRPSAREVAAVLAHAARTQVSTGDPATDEAIAAAALPAPALAGTGAGTGTGTGAGARAGAGAGAGAGASGSAGAITGGLAAAGFAGPSAVAAGDPAAAAAGDPAAAAGADQTAAAGPAAAAPHDPGSDGGAAAAPSRTSSGTEAPSRGRRWAVAAGVAALIVVAWVVWPRGGRDADAPPSGLGAVWSQPAASRPSATSPSVPTSPTSASPVPGRPGATPARTASLLGAPRTPTPSATVTHTAKPTTAPPTAGDPAVRKLSSTGGTVEATCPAADTAQIRSASPTTPYKLLSVDTAPGPAPAAVFKHGKQRITATVTCQAGEPSSADTVTG